VTQHILQASKQGQHELVDNWVLFVCLCYMLFKLVGLQCTVLQLRAAAEALRQLAV
jgi:hypothetical protein